VEAIPITVANSAAVATEGVFTGTSSYITFSGQLNELPSQGATKGDL